MLTDDLHTMFLEPLAKQKTDLTVTWDASSIMYKHQECQMFLQEYPITFALHRLGD